MRNGSLQWMVLVCALPFLSGVTANSVCADIVENYIVGDPFDDPVGAGVAGLNPGDQNSFQNFFDSSPDFSGTVEADTPRSILAGGGDAFFTAFGDGSTGIDFDLGAEVVDSIIAGATLGSTRFVLSDIHSDADAQNFLVEFTPQFLDGSFASDLAELNIQATNGTVNVMDLDGGRFSVELTSNSGSAEIVFTSANSKILRSIDFSSFTPDFESDELRLAASRTLLVSAPEPGSLALISLLGLCAASRRRRTG